MSAPDKAEIAYSTGGTADFTWSFPYNAQQKIKLNSIWAKFGESGEFQQMVAPGEDGTLPFEGTAQVTVPTEEGVYTVQVYGKSNDGSTGAIKSVQYVVDKTAPLVALTGLNQGYVRGAITEDNLKNYKLFIKEKSAAGFPEEPVYTGDFGLGYIDGEYISDQPIGFIDFSADPYEPGTEYTIKLVAEDKSGNKAETTLDVTSPSDTYMPRVIPAELEIEIPERERNLPAFVVSTSQEELKLVGNVLNANWYFGNTKGVPRLINEDGTLQLAPECFYDVYVYKQEDDGHRKFNVQVVENAVHEKFTAGDFENINGNSAETGMVFEYGHSMQRFKIIANESEATFQVKPYVNDENATGYQLVNPNQYYYITDLSEVSAFTNALDIKATATDGKNINDINFEVIADTITNDGLLYSRIENYVPHNLRVEDKINHKTYVKWDIPEELPDEVTYEVYRGTTEDFVPTEENRVASGLKAGYFTEMNVAPGKTFYYKVCAHELLVYEDWQDEYRSTFVQVKGSRTIDQNEFLKRLGMKDFWQFTEFKTTNGNGYVEKSKGNFIYQQKDAEIPNEGFEVSLNRTYNSQSSVSGAFGFGWTHDYDMELLNICENNSTEFTHVVLKDGNGTLYHFTRDPGEQYFVSSLGNYVNLTAEATEQTKEVIVSGLDINNTVSLKYQFVLSTSDGVKYYFNSGGQLILMEDGNEKFVIFEHDAELGVLSKMVTNNNSAIQFVYNDGTGDSITATVKEIILPDGSKVQYEYTKPALSAEQLLTKVTKVASDGSSTVSYVYEYNRGNFSLQPHNLTTIKDATGVRDYKINYDFSDDQVSNVVYPNNEKFTFDYAVDNTYTIVKKFSGGQVVLGEKDYFDRVFGKCEKSIRGVGDVSKLEGTDETGLDVTTYEYRDHLLTSTTMTAEYREVNSDGYVVEKTGTKAAKADYSGDQPAKETEEDGTVSEYTYYDDTSGENLAGQIKTVRETNADGKTVGYKEYAYDAALNTTQVIDYVAGTKIVNTYYTEGVFKGEIHTMQEYLLNVSSTFAITGETLQSTSTYTYENVTTDGVTTKVESCTQVLSKPDGTNETITISSTYDAMGRKLSEVDSRGYRTVNTYDGFERLTATTYKYSDSNALKQSTATTYDDNNMITYEKLADGTEKWYTYDNMYRVTSTKVKKGNTEETINTTYSYQDVDIYQGKGNDTVSVNNAYVTTQSYSDGTVISKTYEDHKGNVVRKYSGGLYTDMTYNSQGDMITKWVMGKTPSASEGVLQLYIHDDKGNLTQTITDPDYISGTETTGYKVRENGYNESDEWVQGSIVTKSAYDSDGNVTSTTDAEGNTTTYTYDSLGNLTSVLQPDDAKYEYQYDVAGLNGTTKDIVLEPRVTGTDASRAMSKSVVTKDATDKVIKVEDLGTSDTDDTSISTSYEYDVRDNLIKATEKNGNYKLYTYDARDRVTSFDYYEMSGDTAVKTLRTEFTYDNSDNITSMTDKEVASDGIETIYRYQRMDMMISTGSYMYLNAILMPFRQKRR